jgi:hypothetical protein
VTSRPAAASSRATSAISSVEDHRHSIVDECTEGVGLAGDDGEAGTRHRLLLKASRNAGLIATVSAMALIVE